MKFYAKVFEDGIKREIYCDEWEDEVDIDEYFLLGDCGEYVSWVVPDRIIQFNLSNGKYNYVKMYDNYNSFTSHWKKLDMVGC